MPQSKRAGAAGAVTEEEKAAIVARLWDLPGVQTIYFQDPGYALKLAKLSDPDYKPDAPMSGSFSSSSPIRPSPARSPPPSSRCPAS
ncbi:hypothetical protein ACFQX6_06975 [Streptosporangium lutulentum]